MKPWSTDFRGQCVHHILESPALRANVLGDPWQRPLWVYTPPGYDPAGSRRYPAIYLIQGLTGQVDMWWNRSAFRPTLPERVDALFSTDDIPPAIVVFVDAWTSLGGSQFLNSPGTGRYQDYLCEDVVGFVDRQYRTAADPAHRGLTGKSSGGYGAMVVPMHRPDVFGALATHAGDALFEYCYLPDIARAARALRDTYHGDITAFWADFRSRPAFTRKDDHVLLNIYCMAACYSAEPDGAVTLPFDPHTGILRDAVWARWLDLDPVRMAQTHADALRGLRGIYIDAGKSDEFYLDVGARAFSAQLAALGIDHTFELFEGGHGGIDYRYPLALRYLAERLS
jgi:S-formylglutathione hydrolase FrmB